MSFIITALAVYGLAALVSSYDGLYGVFARLRNKYPNSPLHCTVCLSCWLVVPIILLGAFVGIWAIAPLAVIGVVILFERLQ